MILSLDMDSDIPIYLQLQEQIIIAIGNGSLKSGEILPTVRQLSADLGINPMTVSKAYQVLKNDGYLTSNRRDGTKVRDVLDIHLDISDRTQLEVLLAKGYLAAEDKEQFKQSVNLILDSLDQHRKE